MDKNSWYYENTVTGQISDQKADADWWILGGESVNYWRWSEYLQEWVVLMVQEP